MIEGIPGPAIEDPDAAIGPHPDPLPEVDGQKADVVYRAVMPVKSLGVELPGRIGQPRRTVVIGNPDGAVGGTGQAVHPIAAQAVTLGETRPGSVLES